MKKILKLFIILSLTLFAFPFSVSAQDAENIENFHAEYTLKKSGVIEVEEEIKYNFGSEERHGIYRYIPYKYQMTDGKTEYINISKIKVQDDLGKRQQYEKSNGNGNIILKIGDPDKTVTGLKTYRITYLVKGGLRYNETDEFYWNVTGNGWQVPIRKASAEVKLEEPIETEKTQVRCFFGPVNSNWKCTAENTLTENPAFTWGARYFKNDLLAGEGLTVVFNAPKGTFDVISAGFMGSGISETAVGYMAIIGAVIVFATFIFMLRHYLKWGKDPKGQGAIVADYEPPKGLTPLEMGTLMDFRVDNKDISAQIIYLATRGYLKIRREDGKGVFNKEDYTLIKLKDYDGKNKFDQDLFLGIFGSKKEVKISELKTSFYETVTSVKSSVQQRLVDKGFFKDKVNGTIWLYVGIGLTIGVLGTLATIGVSALWGGAALNLIFIPTFITSGLIVLLFGLFMPARTKEGVLVKEKSLGFKRYLSMVEGRQIKWADDPKKHPEKFSEYLPYAIVFGVEKQWAKKFEGVIKDNPDWYNDPSGRIFVPVAFVSSVNSFSVATTHSMAAPSSGGAGGGFSGGGFGGGGGGSW